jgi:hypothetical protein
VPALAVLTDELRKARKTVMAAAATQPAPTAIARSRPTL